MKAKITVRHQSGRNYLIEAEPWDYRPLVLYIHRRLGRPWQWTISDKHTGQSLGHGRTKALAREEASRRIEIAGGAEVVYRELMKAPPAGMAIDYWVELEREEGPKVDVDLIAQRIAERAGIVDAEERKAVRRALCGSGPHAGRLLAKPPPMTGPKADQLAAACWFAIQPNAYKLNVFSVMTLDPPARRLYARLVEQRWPRWLDRDLNSLVEMGVW